MHTEEVIKSGSKFGISAEFDIKIQLFLLA
jgi:hypothetical protein